MGWIGWGKPRYSSKQRREMVKLHEQGYNYAEIGRRFGCSPATSRRWVLRAKAGEPLGDRSRCPEGKTSPRQSDKEVEDLVCALWQTGIHSFNRIARVLCQTRPEMLPRGVITHPTVKAILLRRGIIE